MKVRLRPNWPEICHSLPVDHAQGRRDPAVRERCADRLEQSLAIPVRAVLHREDTDRTQNANT